MTARRQRDDPARKTPRHAGQELRIFGEWRLGRKRFPEQPRLDSGLAQVTDQARGLMDRSGVFAHVVDDGSYVEPTHLLEGHIVRLFADFRDRRSPVAVLEMQLFLVEHRGADVGVRVQKRYEQRVPIDVGDYSDSRLGEGIMAGWNVALRRILTDFASEIRRVGVETN